MIEFRNVGKDYNRQIHALHHINFSIDAGEFVFLIGESGAGKSTVIKLLTCKESPTYGTVVLDNFDISRMKRKLTPFLRRKIGMIFQDFRLIESKTVYENVAFAMEIVGAPQHLIERRVPIVLSLVGLRGKSEAYPQELSGGEAQRVGIARAMVNNPRLILADEPTGNLDQANGEAIMALLDEINRAGTTVIACTHDVAMVERMNKRVIELKEGRIIRDEFPVIDQAFDGSACFYSPEGRDESLKQFVSEEDNFNSRFEHEERYYAAGEVLQRRGVGSHTAPPLIQLAEKRLRTDFRSRLDNANEIRAQEKNMTRIKPSLGDPTDQDESARIRRKMLMDSRRRRERKEGQAAHGQ